MHYSRDIEHFLIPHIGQLILGDLTSRQLNAAFAQIAVTRNRSGQPQTACTLQHVHTTLRAALTGAVREGLIKDNPAQRVELPPRERTQAQVWTEARVAEWESTGERPRVAVWTATQLAAFLDYVRDDNLFALWWLIGLRGLRRGEAAGLRWAEVDLHAGQLSVVRQRTTAGYDVYEGPPKSRRAAGSWPWTGTPFRCCASTLTGSGSNARDGSARERCAMTAGTCSPAPTGYRSTRVTSPNACGCWSTGPGCLRSGCTTCGTGRRPSPTPPART
jgi:hypothetical protein